MIYCFSSKYKPFPWWLKMITDGAFAALALENPVAAAVYRSAASFSPLFGLLATLIAILFGVFVALFPRFTKKNRPSASIALSEPILAPVHSHILQSHLNTIVSFAVVFDK